LFTDRRDRHREVGARGRGRDPVVRRLGRVWRAAGRREGGGEAGGGGVGGGGQKEKGVGGGRQKARGIRWGEGKTTGALVLSKWGVGEAGQTKSAGRGKWRRKEKAGGERYATHGWGSREGMWLREDNGGAMGAESRKEGLGGARR